MLWELLISVMSLFSVVLSFMSFIICLPRKFPLPVIIVVYTVYTAMLLVLNYFTDYISILPIPPGWTYIPIVIILFKGHLLQKIFLLFSQLFVSLAIILFFSMLYGFFFPYGSDEIFLFMLVTIISVFTVYIIMILKFGRQLLKRFFEGGSKSEWTLYMITTLAAHTAIFILWRMHEQNNLLHFFALIFIVWSFLILCYAIINTHEKARRKYEADFSRDIITTGREYYQKINEQYDALRIMKHDYKYHLNAALSMLRSGEIEKSDEYLSSLHNQLLEKELPNYCENSVINSLIADYAERCRKMGISFNVSVSFIENYVIPNYEMCIVLGNLLENAVEACMKLESDKNRRIELIIKPKGKQLAIKISNTFDGNVVKDGEKLISTKTGGGTGLDSVAVVVKSFGEIIYFEYNSELFNVYVLWKCYT